MRPFAAINTDSVKCLTNATATLTSQTSSNAMQYTRNTTQQELFNINKMPFSTDFLVYSLIHNVTLLKR